MQSFQVFNVVNNTVLSELITEYSSAEEYKTSTMNKLQPNRAIKLVQDLVDQYCGRPLEFVSGNFYRHSAPYLPHTDYKTYQNNTINVVIPLEYQGTQASLIIFDQEWEQDSVTWCMQHPVKYFDTNIGIKGYPYEYPIKNKTKEPIDTELYEQHLSRFPKHGLFGLTGKAYKFEPGSMIFFNNRKIHCTSNFEGIKLGLSLRYK